MSGFVYFLLSSYDIYPLFERIPNGGLPTLFNGLNEFSHISIHTIMAYI